MSGLSSRSTLMETKYWFRMAATPVSEYDSFSMTWHQWQAKYPIERKIGLFSLRAFSKASLPHGCQSTGLWACRSRYGLLSRIRRFGERDSPCLEWSGTAGG